MRIAFELSKPMHEELFAAADKLKMKPMDLARECVETILATRRIERIAELMPGPKH